MGRPLWLVLGVGGLVALAGLAVFVLRPQAAHVAADPATIYRSYTGTGQVLAVKSLTQGHCQVSLKLHSWVSLSQGFPLAEMPQAGQQYAIEADQDKCMALEVALASQGDPEDLESPRHIYFRAGQARSGQWLLTEAPKAPIGCSGL